MVWIVLFLFPIVVCVAWVWVFVFWIVRVVESVLAVCLQRGRRRLAVVVAVVVCGTVVPCGREERRHGGFASPRFAGEMMVRLWWCSEG